jgi:hypothetical protein
MGPLKGMSETISAARGAGDAVDVALVVGSAEMTPAMTWVS